MGRSPCVSGGFKWTSALDSSIRPRVITEGFDGKRPPLFHSITPDLADLSSDNQWSRPKENILSSLIYF